MSFTKDISRRSFGFGLAAFGLVACSNVTQANQGSVAKGAAMCR